MRRSKPDLRNRLIAIALGSTLSLAVFARPSRAEEESEKVRKARLENDVEKAAEATDAACGTKLAASIVWSGFDADEAWRGKSVSGYCEAPLGALRRFCEGKAAKALIAKRLTRFVCVAAKDKSGWKIEVKGDVLEWHVSPDAVNADAYARKQLLEKL